MVLFTDNMCDHFYGLDDEEFNRLRTVDVLNFTKKYGNDVEPTRDKILQIMKERELTELLKDG